MLHRRTPTFKANETCDETCYRHEVWSVSVCAKLLQQLGEPLNRDDRNEIGLGYKNYASRC